MILAEHLGLGVSTSSRTSSSSTSTSSATTCGANPCATLCSTSHATLSATSSFTLSFASSTTSSTTGIGGGDCADDNDDDDDDDTGVEVAMNDILLHAAVGNGDIEFATAAVNSSFRSTADDNTANSVEQKGESPSEQADSSDGESGDLGVRQHFQCTKR